MKKLTVTHIRTLFLLLLLTTGSMKATADIRLPAVIGSNMVLQQQDSVRLWGWANPYEKITISTSWNSQRYQVTGSRDAHWEVMLQTPAAGGPYTITLQGNNTIVLNDVMIGEVWVCSGQSNMEMCGKWGLKDIKDELPVSANNNIRFFHVPKSTAASPQQQGEGAWTACDSNTLPSFSAVAYFFGKQLNKKLNVPIGLIAASWGGTTAEVWTPESIVMRNPVLKEAARQITPSGQCPHWPGYTWNAMIAPITPFKIAGVIWYQGENNTGTATTYAPLFTAMIDGWRDAWHQPFPFYYVQIAPFHYKKENTGALLREAQAQCASHPRTGMVVTTDLVSDTNDVHPSNKHDVGKRLANWALADTYHQPGIVYQSPVFNSMRIQHNKAIISFDNARNGLVLKGDVVKELLIAGQDGIFYPANATLHKNTLTAWSEQVQKPVAVRYGFRDAATGNLFGKEGLPVAPFRTDNWNVQTK